MKLKRLLDAINRFVCDYPVEILGPLLFFILFIVAFVIAAPHIAAWRYGP